MGIKLAVNNQRQLVRQYLYIAVRHGQLLQVILAVGKLYRALGYALFVCSQYLKQNICRYISGIFGGIQAEHIAAA